MTRLLLPIVIGAALACLALVDAPGSSGDTDARAQSVRTGLCLAGSGCGSVRSGW